MTTDRRSQTFVKEDVFIKSNCVDDMDSESVALFNLQLSNSCPLKKKKKKFMWSSVVN